MTKSPQQSDVEAARHLSPARKKAAKDAWNIVYGVMLDRADAVPAARKLKNFEAYHAIEHARAAFLAALVSGQSISACHHAALAAFPTKWGGRP